MNMKDIKMHICIYECFNVTDITYMKVRNAISNCCYYHNLLCCLYNAIVRTICRDIGR